MYIAMYIAIYIAMYIAISIAVAMASIEFSTNSLTIDAGRSITSPAAILFIKSFSNFSITPIIFSVLITCLLLYPQLLVDHMD